MPFDDLENRADLLTKVERLRQWRNSFSLEEFAHMLLKAFRENPSREDREIVWNGLLEGLSSRDEAFSETIYRDWINELLKALSHSDSELRCQALSSLTDMAKYLGNDDDVLEGIVLCLYDKSKSVRDQAVYAASQFEGRQVFVVLVKSLAGSTLNEPANDDPDGVSVWHALWALDAITDRLSPSSREREEAAGKLFRVLEEILQKPCPSDLDIWKVGDSLGEHVRGRGAFRVLKEMLAHSNPVVRDSAIHGLGHLGGPEAIRLINLALDDPEFEVRDEARRALAEIST